jgi:hypothetical protein
MRRLDAAGRKRKKNILTFNPISTESRLNKQCGIVGGF